MWVARPGGQKGDSASQILPLRTDDTYLICFVLFLLGQFPSLAPTHVWPSQ